MKAHCLFLMCLATVFGTVSEVNAATSPLNCRSDHGIIARTICGSPEYVAMDREISALTDRGMAQFSPMDRRRLLQSEALYLHHRQGCDWAAHHSAHPGAAIDECVRASMEDRVRALRVLVERGGF